LLKTLLKNVFLCPKAVLLLCYALRVTTRIESHVPLAIVVETSPRLITMIFESLWVIWLSGRVNLPQR